MRRTILTGLAAVAAVTVLLVLGRASAPAHATVACPAGYTCTQGNHDNQGKLIVQDPGSDIGNQFAVEDKNATAASGWQGAPMLWTNVFGTFSGGEPFCVTGLRLQALACIGGLKGSYGGQPLVTLYDAYGRNPVNLTRKDIIWIHSRGG